MKLLLNLINIFVDTYKLINYCNMFIITLQYFSNNICKSL